MKVAFLRATSILRVGLKAIFRNKIRSGLTALGILIGVGCVIAMVAVGAGASNAVQSQITALGTNFIMVFPGAVTQSGARIFTGQSTLTEDDAQAIKDECTAVAYVSPSARTGGQVVAGEQNWGTQIYGAGVDFPFIRAWNTDLGAFFTEEDVKAGAKVAVLGRTVSENLFPGGDAVGQTVRIKNVPFRVVGVLEKKGGNQMGQDQDDQVIIPYTTLLKRLASAGHNRIHMILAAATDSTMVEEAKVQIAALLRQRHRIGPGQDDDFMMRSQDEIAGAANEVSRTFSLLLGVVAAVSLFVGGIGIMNITLVSVTERTREIGVRMAVGAKRRHVLAQFLLEAVVLAVAGGAIGVLLGILVSLGISRWLDWPVSVNVRSIVVAFGVSACIGVFFGFYPAWKASRLDPIEALRYE